MLDLLRGVMILLMVGNHLLYDLAYIFGLPVWLVENPIIRIGSPLGAGIFIAMSGATGYVSRSNWVKGLRILAAGAAVTLVTFFYDRNSVIVFGILQFLGVSTLLYAAVRPAWRRLPEAGRLAVSAALFALSVPIAVVGNVVRIVTIAVVGTTCSAEFASGFYHDYSGYVVFLVAVSLMVATGGLISRLCDRASARRRAKDDAEFATVAQCGAACGWKLAVPFVAAVLVIGTMSMQGSLSEPALCEAPAVKLGEIAGFKSEAIPAAEAELNVLPKDTVIDKRVYTASDGNWYKVSLEVGGRSKGSIHRPEMRLPSHGFLMKDPEITDISGVEWRTLTVERGRETSLGFAYTFFNQDGFRTSSHVRRIFRDVIDRSFRRRIDRWAMVTVTSSDADRGRLSQFLSYLKEVVE